MKLDLFYFTCKHHFYWCMEATLPVNANALSCYVGQMSGRPVGGMSMIVLVVALLLSCIVDMTSAGCNGMCQACARRYGCMTPAWGKCCTQFYQHNGRKRNVAESLGVGSDMTKYHKPPKSAATPLSKTPAAKSVISWPRKISPKRVIMQQLGNVIIPTLGVAII